MPDPARLRGRNGTEIRRPGTGVHGPEGRHADHRDRDRPRLHRLLHQRAHRRPAAAAAVVRGHKVSPRVNAMVVPGSAAVKMQAEKEGLAQRVSRRRFRVARSGLQHVPGHEPRQVGGWANAVPRPATATSKAGKAKAAARTSSRPPWPPPPPSPDISWTSASGTTNDEVRNTLRRNPKHEIPKSERNPIEIPKHEGNPKHEEKVEPGSLFGLRSFGLRVSFELGYFVHSMPH